MLLHDCDPNKDLNMQFSKILIYNQSIVSFSQVLCRITNPPLLTKKNKTFVNFKKVLIFFLQLTGVVILDQNKCVTYLT